MEKSKASIIQEIDVYSSSIENAKAQGHLAIQEIKRVATSAMFNRAFQILEYQNTEEDEGESPFILDFQVGDILITFQARCNLETNSGEIIAYSDKSKQWVSQVPAKGFDEEAAIDLLSEVFRACWGHGINKGVFLF